MMHQRKESIFFVFLLLARPSNESPAHCLGCHHPIIASDLRRLYWGQGSFKLLLGDLWQDCFQLLCWTDFSDFTISLWFIGCPSVHHCFCPLWTTDPIRNKIRSIWTNQHMDAITYCRIDAGTGCGTTILASAILLHVTVSTVSSTHFPWWCGWLDWWSGLMIRKFRYLCWYLISTFNESNSAPDCRPNTQAPIALKLLLDFEVLP